MTNTNQTQETEADEIADEARSGRVWTAAFLAALSAYFGFMVLLLLPKETTVGTGIAIAGIASMVAAVCYFIVRAR